MKNSLIILLLLCTVIVSCTEDQQVSPLSGHKKTEMIETFIAGIASQNLPPEESKEKINKYILGLGAEKVQLRWVLTLPSLPTDPNARCRETREEFRFDDGTIVALITRKGCNGCSGTNYIVSEWHTSGAMDDAGTWIRMYGYCVE